MSDIIEEPQLKRCTVCGIVKPASEFYKRKAAKCGLQSRCKQCSKKHYEEHKEYYTKYREDHKEKERNYDILYRARHEMEQKTRCKKYYQENKERLKECGRIYYRENTEQVKERNGKYHKSPMGKLVDLNNRHKRRELRDKTPKKDHLTLTQWQKILSSQKNKCAICGCNFDKITPATMDHIVPLSKGGIHSSDNIQALCRVCNSRKSNKIDYKLIQSWACING